MARGTIRKGQDVQQSRNEATGVVRMAKVIPPMSAPSPASVSEPPEETMQLPCSGRCGHCDYHPCRLHAPI